MTLLLMSIGLILFTLADNTVQPNFDHTGNRLIDYSMHNYLFYHNNYNRYDKSTFMFYEANFMTRVLFF